MQKVKKIHRQNVTDEQTDRWTDEQDYLRPLL